MKLTHLSVADCYLMKLTHLSVADCYLMKLTHLKQDSVQNTFVVHGIFANILYTG